MRRISWNNHTYSTALHNPSFRALRILNQIQPFNIRIKWIMILIAQKATDCKVITCTMDYIIQRHQCTARCRRKSIHVTNSRHESAKTRLYNIKGLQTRMRDSKICHDVNGGYMKRDHLTRLCQSTHKTNQRTRYLE